MGKLIDHIDEEDKKAAETPHPKTTVISRITNKAVKKDKQISVKINTAIYANFAAINTARGTSNNSAINVLITEYIEKYKYLLES